MGITVTTKITSGKRIEASFDGFTVATDMGPSCGGEGSAPEPFDYFFASLATCSALYALNFCDARSISTEGLSVTLQAEKDQEKGLWNDITFEVKLPEDFPVKYQKAIIKAINLCTVKKHIISELHFNTKIID